MPTQPGNAADTRFSTPLAGPVPPPDGERPRLFSIGHSNHELARLLELLHGAGVTAVADVRSQPFSRRLPQFNRPSLEAALKQAGIAYAFLGDQLGGRPRQPELYDVEGRVDYERVRATAAFRQGLDRLIRALDRYAVALLCGEEDPLDCHRGLMIAPALAERGLSLFHVRKDGRLESTAEMEERLLAITPVVSRVVDGLFACTLTAEERRQWMAEAYRIQARQKAFRLPPGGVVQELSGFADGDDGA